MKRAFLFSALALAATSAHATFVIDTFDSGDFNESLNAGIGSTFQAGSMTGGNRLSTLAVQSNGFGLAISGRVSTGNYSLSSQAVVDGYGILSYGYTGDPNNPTKTDLNLNLSADSAFEVDVLLNDMAASLTISVRSASQNSGNFVSSTVNLPPSATTTSVLFSTFGGFDFSDVDQVEFKIDTDVSGDITIGEVRAVPEPATLLLLTASLAAICRKKHQKKS